MRYTRPGSPCRPMPPRALRPARLLLGAGLLFALTAPGAPALAQAADAEGPSIGTSREALARWVETRQQISKEREAARRAKQLLLDRIELVRAEIEEVRGSITEQEQSISTLDDELAELRERNERLKAASDRLAEAIGRMEVRTLVLLDRVPKPLREEVKPLAQQIPGYQSDKERSDKEAQPENSSQQSTQGNAAADADAAEASDAAVSPESTGESTADADPASGSAKDEEEKKVPLTLRYQSVLGVLNRVNAFHGQVQDSYEQVERGNGERLSVSTLFLGLGQGYYVSPEGTAGGVGYATEDGWVWRSDDAIAPLVEQAIAVMKNERPATFVTLPVEVK